MESSLSEFGKSVPQRDPRSNKPKSGPPGVSAESEEKEDMLNASTLTQWAICGPHTYKPVSVTYPKLSSGVYDISVSQYHGIIFEKKTICVDDLLRFPDSVSEKILAEITTFWSKGDRFKEYGYLHRRGYLLHGPAGSGKTCLVQQIIADIINSGGLVFQCSNHPSVFNDGLSVYRKVEPDRPVVCLFEDIDAIIDEHGEDDILTLLDGENQIDKVLNLATTNYPEKLDPRLVARPRRFDRVLKIGMPSDEVRRMYFTKKLKLKVVGNELDKWVELTNGFSFAACAELVISVCCFEKPLEKSVEILKEMMDARPSSSKYSNDEEGLEGFGFGQKKK